VKHQHHLQPDNGIVTYAYWCVMIGVFVTAFYSFRLLFMTFHGKPRWEESAAHAAHGDHAHADHAHADHAHADHAHDDHGHGHHGGPPQKELRTMTWPLIALAIPSIAIGALTFEPLLFKGGFGASIFNSPENQEVLREIGEGVGDWWHFGIHSLRNPVFYIVVLGFLSAWVLYIKRPHWPDLIDSKLKPLRVVLENKYWFDWFNENVIAAGSRLLGKIFWKGGDGAIIDTGIIGGTTGFIDWAAGVIRRVQSGFLYSYAFWMVIGLVAMLAWFLSRATA
jgi:NADH-quinone oxidoreductase subunit L